MGCSCGLPSKKFSRSLSAKVCAINRITKISNIKSMRQQLFSIFLQCNKRFLIEFELGCPTASTRHWM